MNNEKLQSLEKVVRKTNKILFHVAIYLTVFCGLLLIVLASQRARLTSVMDVHAAEFKESEDIWLNHRHISDLLGNKTYDEVAEEYSKYFCKDSRFGAVVKWIAFSGEERSVLKDDCIAHHKFDLTSKVKPSDMFLGGPVYKAFRKLYRWLDK